VPTGHPASAWSGWGSDVRIIGGRFRRRTLTAPKGRTVRPTSDRLRETLFNVLGPGIEGLRVLDAFAGTGALGLEAVSRGAAEAVLVECDRHALEAIAENVRRFDAAASCRVVRGRFPAAIHPTERFDVVLLDPPYAVEALDEVVAAAETRLVPAGLVILEHSRRRPSPEAVGGLMRVRLLTAGDSALSFYRHEADETPAAHD
jgi:16S rRNA (guanine966-N2)-methyltransferase